MHLLKRNLRNRPMPLGRAFAIAVMLAILLPGTARAQTLEMAETAMFTVRGVAVDVTAETAAEARRQALRDGQIEALDRMLRRLTRRADHGALPVSDAGTAAFLVQGFEVANEKTSPVRYLAELTVRFKPGEVRRLLRQTGLPFAETASKPLVVLPVLKVRDSLLLWGGANFWRNAWTALPVRRGLVPMIVPFGDLTDISTIDATQAMLGDGAALSAIAERYNAGSALVALATLSVREEGLLVLDVAASRPTDPDDVPTLLTFTAASAEEVEELMGIAAAETASGVEDVWLGQHLLRFDSLQSMTLAVPVIDLEEWISVERRLHEIATISRVSVRVLRRDSAEVEIDYFGDESQLVAALAQRDLELEEALPHIVVQASPTFSPSMEPEPDVERVRVLRSRGR